VQQPLKLNDSPVTLSKRRKLETDSDDMQTEPLQLTNRSSPAKVCSDQKVNNFVNKDTTIEENMNQNSEDTVQLNSQSEAESVLEDMTENTIELVQN